MSLTAVQRRSAELLAAGYTQAEAAKRVGTSDRSIRRWLAEDVEFQIAAQADTDSITDQTPVEVLRSLLSSDNDTVRLRAAAALHEINQHESAPDQRGATIYVAAHVVAKPPLGPEAPIEMMPFDCEVQLDLPPGSADRLVLHRQSAPLPLAPFTPHPDPTKWPPLAEDAA